MANNTGTFFNVNDNDGIPLVGVSTNGKVMINHLYGNCLIGSTSVTGTASQPLQVTGGAYVSGNLGVGVTNPSYKLQVGGATSIGGNFYAPYAYISGGTEINDQLYLNLNGNAYAEAIAIRGGSGSSGGASVKWQSPFGDTAYVGHKQAILSGTGYDYTIFTTSGLGFGVVTNNRTNYDFYIDTSGNALIGIGTTSTGTSNQRLQVTGGAYVSGNLGIGTTNPTSKLHIVGGDIRVGVNTSQGVILTSENGTKFRLLVSDSGVLSTVLVP